jgi:N,N'-diacetyllegionaminate synthase
MKLKKKNELFITAEIGLNHNNNYSKTIKLINLAIKAGADAVKFQLFKTESLYPKKQKHLII